MGRAVSKRRHKKKSLPVRVGEMATKERRCQNGGVISEVIDRDLSGKVFMKRHRASCECVLDDLLRRLTISEPEYETGMKFRWAYLKHVFKVKVCDGGYNPFLNEGCNGDAESNMNAMCEADKLLHGAYGVLSDAQRSIVIAVCGHDEWPGTTARARTLHRGLEKLFDLWSRGKKSFSKMQNV